MTHATGKNDGSGSRWQREGWHEHFEPFYVCPHCDELLGSLYAISDRDGELIECLNCGEIVELSKALLETVRIASR